MSYRINGPTEIGDTGALNTINGDLTFVDITTTQGNMFTVDASGNVAPIVTGTSGQALVSNGPGTAPTFQTLPAVTIENFAVDKDAGDTFDDTPTVIPSWNITSAYRYNTGSLAVATGLFTATNTGNFACKAQINYSNTNNSGSRTLELFDTTNTAVIASTTVQPTGSTAIANTIVLTTDALLTAGDVYALRFSRDVDVGTNTIEDTSHWSMNFAN